MQPTAARKRRHGCVRPVRRHCAQGRRLHSRLILLPGRSATPISRGDANALGFPTRGHFLFGAQNSECIRKGPRDKSFSDAASAPKHPAQAETGATTTDDARTRDGPSRACFARNAQRALMLRQGDGRSGDAMDCRRVTAMRRIDRRFAAARIPNPPGARGFAVAYAEDRTRVLREGGSSAWIERMREHEVAGSIPVRPLDSSVG